MKRCVLALLLAACGPLEEGVQAPPVEPECLRDLSVTGDEVDSIVVEFRSGGRRWRGPVRQVVFIEPITGETIALFVQEDQ